MAYTTIKKPTDYFNTITYTGNGANSTARTVGFDPDWIWVKNRGGTDNHYLMDKVRGLDYNLESNNTDAQARDYLISGTTSTAWTSSNSGEINANNGTFVAWNWKAGGTGSANTDGSINTTATSVNTTAGFSISKYTGTGSNATVGHGLGVAPKIVIIKKTSGADDWKVYHASVGATKSLVLQGTNAETSDSTSFNSTAPTTSVFSVGTSSATNTSGQTYIAYCFAEKTGYSKFGSYTGNGNADGTFVYTGFTPAFFMCKGNADINWQTFDNKRSNQGGFNINDEVLAPNTNGAEYDEGSSSWGADFLSNGFKPRGDWAGFNTSGRVYYYIAFAAEPLVGDNPATAR